MKVHSIAVQILTMALLLRGTCSTVTGRGAPRTMWLLLNKGWICLLLYYCKFVEFAVSVIHLGNWFCTHFREKLYYQWQMFCWTTYSVAVGEAWALCLYTVHTVASIMHVCIHVYVRAFHKFNIAWQILCITCTPYNWFLSWHYSRLRHTHKHHFSVAFSYYSNPPFLIWSSM